MVKDASMCGLGTTLPNPVLSTLRYFRDEYEAHITDEACPAKACKQLIKYSIDPDKCTGCGLCAEGLPGRGHPWREQAHPRHRPGNSAPSAGECFEVCPPKVEAVREADRQGGARAAVACRPRSRWPSGSAGRTEAGARDVAVTQGDTHDEPDDQRPDRRGRERHHAPARHRGAGHPGADALPPPGAGSLRRLPALPGRGEPRRAGRRRSRPHALSGARGHDGHHGQRRASQTARRIVAELLLARCPDSESIRGSPPSRA